MQLRDKLNVVDAKYFDVRVEKDTTFIQEDRDFIQSAAAFKNPKSRAQYVFNHFREHYELLIEKYSRGDDLNELRAMLPEIVDTWEWALREELKVFTPEEMATRKSFAENFDFYVVCLWMVSIALCLEVDDDLFKRMLAVIGNEGQDSVFECLVATRVPGRRPAEKGAQAYAYGELIQLTANPSFELNPGRLKRFVDRWYDKMQPAYWHDCHLGKEGGGYFGYWCFEAAAVAKMFHIDDSGVRDSPYYPKDLVAFVCP